jgi:prepilin-type N-terminal cleavage/methylation domain-containing protein/prepilin-type processing-associated H-X9-DG protein
MPLEPRSVGIRRAFTLIELLIVIAIIAVLVGLLVPAVQKVRNAVAGIQCKNNLKQLALTAHSYHDVNKKYPAAMAVVGQPYYGPWTDLPYSTWVAPLMPFMDQGNLYTAWITNPQVPGWGANGGPDAPNAGIIPILLCPADPSSQSQFQVAAPAPGPFPNGVYIGLSSYGVNFGTQQVPSSTATPLIQDGVFHYNSQIQLTGITDGASNTILFGERCNVEPRWRFLYPALPELGGYWSGWIFGGWYHLRQPLVEINYRLPASVETSPPTGSILANLQNKRLGSYGSMHSGGCNMAFADGSVRFINDNLPLITLISLTTRAGGELGCDF